MTDERINELEKAQLIWDEYKYRHEHCWRNLYRLIAAVLALSIVPYLENELSGYFEWLLIIPAFLAVGLIILSLNRIDRELEILKKVKDEHRKLQKRLCSVDAAKVRKDGNDKRDSTFNRDVSFFIRSLLVLAVLNALVAIIWLCVK